MIEFLKANILEISLIGNMILLFCLFSPNIVYLLHKRFFNWKPKVTKNLALEVLKEVYSHGDEYHCGENDLVWYAFFSNDYPLQHGEGWSLTISKKDFSFRIDKEGDKYKETIEKSIKWKSTLYRMN